MNIFKAGTIFLCVLAGACSGYSNKNKGVSRFNFNKADISLEIEVLLPDSYGSSSDKTYPVLYLLDGFWNRDPIQVTYNSLRFDNMIPEIIIISVGYPEAIEDFEEQRMWDLTSVYDTGFKAGGNASVMFDVISEEIIPFVEESYSIDKERTILTGHSLAGLFTLYVMYQSPDTFTHYAAISPSALWANEALSNIDQEYAKKAGALQTNLYITYGTDEYDPYVSSLKNYIQQLEGRRYEELNLTLATVEGLRHVGMKSEGFLRGLVWSLSDLKPTGPSEFEKKNIDALK